MLDDCLFKHTGKKIMLSARILFFIEAGLSVIFGIVFICQDDKMLLTGLLCLFIGPVVAYFSSLLLYGYGKLIFNSQMMYHIYFKLPLSDKDEDEYPCYIDAEGSIKT